MAVVLAAALGQLRMVLAPLVTQRAANQMVLETPKALKAWSRRKGLPGSAHLAPERVDLADRSGQ